MKVKFDDLFRTTINSVIHDEKTMCVVQNVAEALDSLSKQLIYLNQKQDPTENSLRTTKLALQRFVDEFNVLKDIAMSQNRIVRPQDINQKYQIIGNLTFIIDSSLSVFEIQELACTIQTIICHDDFTIDPAGFLEKGSLFTVSMLLDSLFQRSLYLENSMPSLFNSC